VVLLVLVFASNFVSTWVIPFVLAQICSAHPLLFKLVLPFCCSSLLDLIIVLKDFAFF